MPCILVDMSNRPLTIADAVALAGVIDWAIHNRTILWLNDRNEVERGTARSIGDVNGNFLAQGEDVRDAFLRVTTASGWEWFVPMSDVLARNGRGEMVPEAK